MDYDRLRDLQAKFDENPRRYFAPLANEYRKGGNPKRAIEICRAHLAQMPGHMSGQVVYGQALFEGAEFEEAKKVFEGAIVLDPENLIALRSLGDLALQAGNPQEARTWYKRLLEADPKDTAVIALIGEIDGSSDAGAPTAEGESTFVVDFSFVDQPGATPAAAGATAGESPVTEAADADARPVDSAVEGLTSQQPEPESAVPPAEASARPDEESALAVGAPDNASAEADAAQSDAPAGLERHYPTEDSAPSVAEETLPVGEPMGPDRDADVAAARPVAATAPQAAASEFAGSSFAGTSGNPEPFVNETMAQLYLQQGYRQLALRVYRQLSDMRPTEQALRDRIAEIEAMQRAEDRGGAAARREGPSIESPTPAPSAPRSPSIESPSPHGPSDSPPSSPSREPDSVESPVRREPRAEPEGIAAQQTSIREFFATLGRRRPQRPAAPPGATWGGGESGNRGGGGESAPSAALDSVFAGANVSAKDARAASTLAGAFSASARGNSPPPPAPTTPTPRANPRLQSHESEEDVAKFRAWLDGLTGE